MNIIKLTNENGNIIDLKLTDEQFNRYNFLNYEINCYNNLYNKLTEQVSNPKKHEEEDLCKNCFESIDLSRKIAKNNIKHINDILLIVDEIEDLQYDLHYLISLIYENQK